MPDILKSAQTQIDDLDLPFSSRGHDLPQEPEPIPIIPPAVAKKHSNKSLILAVILFLVATLPLAVYFTSQQRQLNDLRGRAQEGAYPGSCGNAGQACCDPFSQNGTICNGNLYCNGSTCQSAAPANLCQGNQGSAGTAGTKCKIYRCGSRCNNGNQCNLGESIVDCGTNLGECGQIDWLDTNNNYCGVKEQNCGGSCAGTTTTSTGGSTTTTTGGTTTTTTTNNPTATPTPTPTPVPGGTCELIKLYDAAGTTEITQAVRNGTKKLAIGEQVIIATSKGNATKARFRIQGIADWAENDSSKTTATEYRLSITIPSTMTQAQGTFEAEVYVNGVWK